MDERRALGVGVGAHRREERRDAGADVGAQHQKQHAAVGRIADGQPRRHHLHDEGGDRRGGLHDARDDDARQQQHEAVIDADEEIFDDVLLGEVVHRHAHVFEAEEHQPQARQHHADGLYLLFFAQHVHEDADAGEEGDDLDEGDIGDDRKIGGDGGADVGAHDDRRRLEQRHQPRVDEADHHDRGRRRALDDRRDARADADARQAAFARFIEPAAQAVGGELFDIV